MVNILNKSGNRLLNIRNSKEQQCQDTNKGTEAPRFLSPKSELERLFSNQLTGPRHPKMTSGMEPNIKVNSESKTKEREITEKEETEAQGQPTVGEWARGRARKKSGQRHQRRMKIMLQSLMAERVLTSLLFSILAVHLNALVNTILR